MKDFVEDAIHNAARAIGATLCRDRRKVYSRSKLASMFNRWHGDAAVSDAILRLVDGGVIEPRNNDWKRFRGLKEDWPNER